MPDLPFALLAFLVGLVAGQSLRLRSHLARIAAALESMDARQRDQDAAAARAAAEWSEHVTPAGTPRPGGELAPVLPFPSSSSSSTSEE